jgi:CheY-like chemotaxis protein
MLGGRVWVESELGIGSRFFMLVPCTYRGIVADEEPLPPPAPVARRLPVLVVEDRAEDRAVVEGAFENSAFVAIAADRLPQAQTLLAAAAPVAVVLDILLHGEDSWRFLPDVKRANLPVIVVSTLDERRKAAALGADAYCLKPVAREWLLDTLYQLVLKPRLRRVLIADDDPAVRESARALLRPYCDEIFDATDGREAVRLARDLAPSAMLLDLAMPAMSGFEVLEALRAESSLRDLPVLVCTSGDLSDDERDTLSRHGASLMSKEHLRRDALFAGLAAVTKAERTLREAPRSSPPESRRVV